jgi:hypothetical protein
MSDLPIEPDDLVEQLRFTTGYWYLATPYSKYPGGIEAAFQEACRVSAWLIRQEVRLYCPIAHTHPIAVAGGIDPHDHKIWLPADKPFMDAAEGIVVAMMPTWEESYGIKQEIDEFKRTGRILYYMRWPR